ncbi:MAG: hypothetical protein M1830_010137 [Pleopsidium flavum]|nr:MAG: hypothetical protein M1830_010137 [Pleopsidium flavum]
MPKSQYTFWDKVNKRFRDGRDVFNEKYSDYDAGRRDFFMRKTLYYEKKERRQRERRHGHKEHKHLRHRHHYPPREPSFDSYNAPPYASSRASYGGEVDEYGLGYDPGDHDRRSRGRSSRGHRDRKASGRTRSRSSEERYDSKYSDPPQGTGPFGEGPSGSGGYDSRGYDRPRGEGYGRRYVEDHSDDGYSHSFGNWYGQKNEHDYGEYRYRDRQSYVPPYYEPRSSHYWDRGGNESPSGYRHDNRESRYRGPDDYGRYGGFQGGRYGHYERPSPDSNRHRDRGGFDARSGRGPSGRFASEDEYSEYSCHEEHYPRPPPSGGFDGGRSDAVPKPASPEPEEDRRTHYEVLGVSPDVDRATLEKAAKLARITAHPDKRVRPEMSSEEKQAINEEAAKVGQAADILTNPRKRAVYNRGI